MFSVTKHSLLLLLLDLADTSVRVKGDELWRDE